MTQPDEPEGPPPQNNAPGSPDGGAPAPVPVQLEDEMRVSFLDYAMSVIVARALPDVRDGLKPVHRRILYAMNDSGNTHNRAYRKSARTVGDVLGKYHPHGDAPAYEALVRMAQDFSMRAPLIDGQGNFGSVDGDPPAAMRYTEARLAKLAGELLADIEKETVDFGPNYDDTTVEPLVLPARFPNLLVNGSQGIAVGMATSIPPHNLREVLDACIAMIRDPDIGLEELLRIVPGPDFPTGGVILGRDGIRRAYETGRGSVKVRGVANIEPKKKGGEQIVITELPYQVNKAKLIERIAELVGEKKIEGISDVRDESDRDGLRVVVELRRDAIPQVTLNQLWANTALEQNFGVNMLAIVDGQPRVLSLKDALARFIEHRREVVTRRTLFELREAEKKFHVLVGLLAALDNIDRVIEIIRAAKDPGEARDNLVAERFTRLGNLGLLVDAEDEQITKALAQGFVHLTERQAQAILELRLHRLTGLERDKVAAEAQELKVDMARLRGILSDDNKLIAVIIGELESVRDGYSDARRTQITGEAGVYTDEDLIAEEEMVVTVSHAGYVKRTPTSEYRAQKRGGKGVTGAGTKSEDFVEELFVASTHAYLLVFTDLGKVYWLKVHEIPAGNRTARGKPLVNLIQIASEEKMSAIVAVRDFDEDKYIITASKGGTVKRTALKEYARPRQAGIIGAGIAEGDKIIAARVINQSDDILLVTKMGKAVRFRASDVRNMGRPSVGVRGIRLGAGDECVALTVIEKGAQILSVTRNGYGKRTDEDKHPLKKRGGMGVIVIKTSERNGGVVGVRQVTDQDHIMIITDGGTVIRMAARDISVLGRNTQGVRLVRLTGEERVQAIATLAEGDDEGEVAKPVETTADDVGDDAALEGDTADDMPSDDVGASPEEPGDDDGEA